MAAHWLYSKGQNDAGGSNEQTAVLGMNLAGMQSWGLIAIAVAQELVLIQNLNLAQDYYNTNKIDWDFWANQYANGPSGAGYGPMNQSLDEAMDRPLYENTTNPTDVVKYGKLDYLASIGRGRSVSPRKLDRQWLATRKRINNYGVGMGRWVDYQFGINRLNEDMNGWNIGFRFEDTRKYKYDEQRHSHRTQILNLGIGFGNAARAGLAASVAALSETRAQLASQFGSLANDLGQKKGYDDITRRLRNAQLDTRMAAATRPSDRANTQIQSAEYDRTVS